MSTNRRRINQFVTCHVIEYFLTINRSKQLIHTTKMDSQLHYVDKRSQYSIQFYLHEILEEAKEIHANRKQDSDCLVSGGCAD